MKENTKQILIELYFWAFTVSIILLACYAHYINS